MRRVARASATKRAARDPEPKESVYALGSVSRCCMHQMAGTLVDLKGLVRDRLFWFGLAIRAVLLLIVVPIAVQQWYAPFLQNALTAASIDPWEAHLSFNADLRAFPYGYAMWLTFLPLGTVANAVGLSMVVAYGATMLIVDLAMLVALHGLTDGHHGRLIRLYWLSPIIIFATYWLGLNDLIPAIFLVVSLNALKHGAPRGAAVALAAAISAKVSMVVAAPFFFFYLIHNKRLRVYLSDFAWAFGIAMLILQGSYMLSSSGRQMLFGNPELGKVYGLYVPIGEDLRVYILPLIYLLVLFWAWRIRRMSFDLFLSLMGISFFLILILTAASPGWFVWVLPFLVLYQLKSDHMAVVLVAALGILYIGLHAVISPPPDIAGLNTLSLEWSFEIPNRFLSLWQTMLVATGLVLAARMLREGVQANEFFLLSRKPLVIGIAGDSGSGKDTLADGLAGLFGQHSVVRASGDDYHLWDRRGPMWQAMTHLNPRANDLARFTHDVQALAGGKQVVTRRYNHTTGILSKPFPLRSNDIVIVSGLHALYVPAIREICDVRVFLDMDEKLRTFLKLRRDTTERSQTVAQVQGKLQQREADAARFIRPQARHSDVVFALRPVHADIPTNEQHAIRLKLHVQASHNIYYEEVIRALIAICGLHVDRTEDGEQSELGLTIEGDVDAEDIALAADHVFPQARELLDLRPAWQDGLLGVMQLIVLSHIVLAFQKRLR